MKQLENNGQGISRMKEDSWEVKNPKGVMWLSIQEEEEGVYKDVKEILFHECCSIISV